MSVIAEIIDTLENKIAKLFLKIDTLEKNNQDLRSELKNTAVLLQNQSKEVEILKTQLESLKIANTLLGSDENKRDTKLKINSIIREIDYCIAQLAD